MSIEQKIAELLEESKKLQEDSTDHLADAAKHLAAAKAAKEKSKDPSKGKYDRMLSLSDHHGSMADHHISMADHHSSIGNDEKAKIHNAKAKMHDDKQADIHWKVDSMHKEDYTNAEDHMSLSEEDKAEYDLEEITIDVSEDVAALVNGEDLSEEFKTKAATIFEAAVVSRVKQEIAKLEEEFDTKLAEQVESIKEGLVEKVDGYLNYVVEQWMTDNELALENGMKNEITESFISGMKGLFEQHHIEIPEEKFDVLAELQEEAEAIKAKLNEQLSANVELTKQVNEMKRGAAIKDFSTGMADTDVEKFKGLAEELIYEDAESFKTKLHTIKENYFGKKVTPSLSSVVTDEPVTLMEEAEISPHIAATLRLLGKK